MWQQRKGSPSNCMKCCLPEILVFWIDEHRSKQMPKAVGCEEDYM
jgi:hypothetical protein